MIHAGNPLCICREYCGPDTLKVEEDCPAAQHGPCLFAQSEVITDNRLYPLAPRRGACYKVETSYGDDRPRWFVYRRVRASIAGYTECHRFETRSDGMRVLYLTDAIRTEMLLQQTRINEGEWQAHWALFQETVLAPWGVE